MMMSFENTPDRRLITFYHNVRDQVVADAALGSAHRLTGDGVQRYAQGLEAEMHRRGLAFTPIVWPWR
jgi:hypothetical protein